MSSERRILIISMNALSDVTNNGKTIASFFKGYPVEKIAQLYFSPDLPQNTECMKYYRINDMDMLTKRFKKDSKCGGVVRNSDFAVSGRGYSKLSKKIKQSQMNRLLRERLWNDGWKTEELKNWLYEFEPEIIFFVGGDVVYSYKICLYIRKLFQCKLITYITDDYVLPRMTINPFWWLRRNCVLKYMRYTVSISDKFITISDYMRDVYRTFLNKDSYVAVNMSESLKSDMVVDAHDSIELVYAGGLHFNRDKMLIKISNLLRRISEQSHLQIHLKIYSGQTLTAKQINDLTVYPVSSFEGMVQGEELKQVLNKADILVHVESFSRKNIYDTKLSLSTKIPEYLSVGKLILAVGPKEIASMQYLKDCAYCINDLKDCELNLSSLLSDRKLWRDYAEKAEKKYMEKHLAEDNKEEMKRIFHEI